MQHTEEPFPRDHPLKGEMQENNLRQRLDPQPQPQLYKQGEEDEEQLLKHHPSSHQLSEHHAHHVQEISKHPHVTADSSAGRGDGFRQMTGRERIRYFRNTFFSYSLSFVSIPISYYQIIIEYVIRNPESLYHTSRS